MSYHTASAKKRHSPDKKTPARGRGFSQPISELIEPTAARHMTHSGRRPGVVCLPAPSQTNGSLAVQVPSWLHSWTQGNVCPAAVSVGFSGRKMPTLNAIVSCVQRPPSSQIESGTPAVASSSQRFRASRIFALLFVSTHSRRISTGGSASATPVTDNIPTAIIDANDATLSGKLIVFSPQVINGIAGRLEPKVERRGCHQPFTGP
jgi:hypothetical protein